MRVKDLWGKLSLKANGKKDDNLLNLAFYRYLQNGSFAWLGKDRTQHVTKGYSDNEIVYAIVRLLLSKLTEAPLMVNKVVSDTGLKKYKSFVKKGGNDTARVQALTFSTKALEEVEKHPLVDLLKQPNDYQGQAEFLESAFGYYKLLGETFIYGIGPTDGINAGKFTELHVLPAHLVEPVFSGDPYAPIRGYKFLFADPNVEIPAANVMHLRTWNPNWDTNGTQLRGFAPLEAGNKVLTRNGYNKTAQTKAFVNGGAAYLLSSGNADRVMSIEQIEAINDKIREKIKGPENYKNITATNGLVAVNKIGDTPADMELIEADKNDLHRLCILFGVDPILFDPSNSTMNNKEQAYKSLVSNVVLSDLIRFRDKLNNFLLKGYQGDNLFIDFDTTVFAELQPDLKLMKEVYGQPLLTPNEVRSVFSWDANDSEGMNEIWMPSGLIKMSDAGIPDTSFDEAVKVAGLSDYERK